MAFGADWTEAPHDALPRSTCTQQLQTDNPTRLAKQVHLCILKLLLVRLTCCVFLVSFYLCLCSLLSASFSFLPVWSLVPAFIFCPSKAHPRPSELPEPRTENQASLLRDSQQFAVRVLTAELQSILQLRLSHAAGDLG